MMKRMLIGFAMLLALGGVLPAQEAVAPAQPVLNLDRPIFDPAVVEFLRKVDAEKLSLLPLQYSGRMAIFDTLAREQLDEMYGSANIEGFPPAVARLELFFNSGLYLDRPLIYVREKQMRGALSAAMTGKLREVFDRTHRLPAASLIHNDAIEELYRAGRLTMLDLKGASEIPHLNKDLGKLGSQPAFRVPLERLENRFAAFIGVGAIRLVRMDRGYADLEDILMLAQSPELAANEAPLSAADRAVIKQYDDLCKAWQKRDAAAVNVILEQRYRANPPGPAASLELWYNRAYKAMIAWIGFAAALLLFLAAAATRARWPRRAGMAALAISTAVLLAGFVVRWLLSGRPWYLPPIMNQFEAVTGSALLAAALAFVLELVRKQNYFAIAASLYATVSLLAGFFLPQRTMGADISAMHGVLDSPIMAVHVAVIIVGHAMAGMTLVISLIYAGVAVVKRFLPAPAAPSGGAIENPPGALAAIDRCNLIVAQIAVWTVVLGTALGAYWGDKAWGRWWGWDPKETWALVTCLIFIATLHARYAAPARWKGAVTAVGCVLGCGAMIFNWTAVNYLFAGMHSYA